MSSVVKFQSPRLKTINLEIKDYGHYFEDEFDIESVDLDFNFEFGFNTLDAIEIFIHLRISIFEENGENSDENEVEDKDVKFSVYHSDHIINVPLQNKLNDSDTLSVGFLAHLLGTSIIMLKGYFDNITEGNAINEFSLPIFYPTDLIKAKYNEIISEEEIPVSALL